MQVGKERYFPVKLIAPNKLLQQTTAAFFLSAFNVGLAAAAAALVRSIPCCQ